MKKMFNKMYGTVCKTLLVIALLFSVVAPSINTIAAATYNVQERFIGSWTAVAGGSEALRGSGTFITVNGGESWCFQANKGAATGANEEITPEVIGVSRDMVARLSLIAWYGYRSQPSDDNYVLTQNLIWQELGYLSYYKSAAYPTKASMQGWFNDVLSKVNSFGNMPSFQGETYEVNVNQTLTLEDTNGVLSALNVESVSGALVTKSGNTLSIVPDITSNDTIRIFFNRGLTPEQTQTNFIVRQGNSQAVSSCFSGGDPYDSWVNIKVNKFGSLELEKQDNKTNFVPGTSFKLSYNADMSSPIGTYTTSGDGKIKVDELLPQKVYIQETAVPDHLILDSTIYSKDIVSNVTTLYNAVNNWKQGYIQAVKKDLDSGKVVKKAGTIFNVYRNDNALVATITSNASGVAKTGLLDYGDYYIQETRAPNGFTIDTTKYPINVRTHLETVEQIVSNKEVRGSIELTKEDSETGGTAQGSSSLLGAKYKLYAKSNIIDPADGSILISANTMISEKEIDSNRKIVWEQLYLGEYYVQESLAPTGYNIDPTKHNVTLSYADQNTAIITKSTTSKEDVIRGDIYLVKYLDDTINNPSLQKPGKNIVFKITSKTNGSSIYIKTNEHGHASTQKEYYKDEACTQKFNSNTRGALPFDTYTIEEVASTTPPGFIPAGKWEATISAQGSVLHYIIKNTDINSPVIVVKADKTTGNTIPMANTEFELYDKDMKLVTMTTRYPSTVVHKSFKTDQNGQFQFPEMVPFGKYFLKEINAPDGYLKGELLEFDVASNDVGNWEKPLVISFYDNPAMGKANIQKIDDNTGDGIVNTVIGIYAREDIVTLDGTTRALKDELVDTVTTIAEGKATTKELFLGKYYAKESKQAPGFSLSDQEYDFELKYKDQDTAVVEVEVELRNTPTEFKLVKKDKDTGEVLEGVTYKVWNKDIENSIENDEIDLGFGIGNNLLDPIFNFMTTYTTNENGEINIKYLMPGTYNVVEEETIDGYILDDTVHEFTVDENGLINNKAVYELEVTNSKTKTTFSKVDTEGKLLEGAEFDIVDAKTKEVITSFTSKLEPVVIEKLIDGKEYILRETEAPEGYKLLTEDVSFTIDKTNTSVAIVNELLLTQIQVNKVDSQTNLPVLSKDFQFTMYSDKECTQVLDVVNADTEDGTATFKDVVYGQIVYIKETSAPEGYLLSDEVKEITLNMELEGIGEIHSFVYLNDLMPIIVTEIPTGDNANAMCFIGLLFVSLGSCIMLVGYKKYERAKKSKKL